MVRGGKFKENCMNRAVKGIYVSLIESTTGAVGEG